MRTRSVAALFELHLFNLPPPMLVSVIESLPFEEIVRMVDFIMLSNAKGRQLWHSYIKRSIRCPDMDNRRYSRDDGGSLRWVLKREINIRNFTTRELNGGWTELHYACQEDEAWLVRACIAFNDDVNAPDEKGFTPLHVACELAHVDIIKLLLESGAQPSLYHKNSVGGIPIVRAVINRRVDTVKLLLSYHEKDKKIESVGNAFVLAAFKQYLEIVKLFLEASMPDIIHSHHSQYGNTALHESCRVSDDTEVMEFLLESGAAVNAVNNDGWSPLFYAVGFARPECAKVLLAAGATVNHRRNGGDTPLDYALSRADGSEARAEMVGLLEAAGGLRGADLPDDDEDDSDDEDA